MLLKTLFFNYKSKSIFAADQFDWMLFFLLTLHSECFAISKTCKLHYDLQVLAEMVGTFLLLFCVCGIVACTQILRGEVGLMEYASVAGLTIIVVIFSIGSISGAHVNPAVTIAFATFGHFPWSKVKKSSKFYLLIEFLHIFIHQFTYTWYQYWFLPGSTLHFGSNSRFSIGNICWKLSIRRKNRTYDNPASYRLQFCLLGGIYGHFHAHVPCSLVNKPIPIRKANPTCFCF